jgi:hypothetical protein
VFSSGGYKNPTLALVGLALRIADRIKTRRSWTTGMAPAPQLWGVAIDHAGRRPIIRSTMFYRFTILSTYCWKRVDSDTLDRR